MDKDPSTVEKVLLEGIDGSQKLVSKRFLAVESGYFRSLFYSQYLDSTSPIQKLPFTGELLDEILASLEKAQKNEVPIWSLTKAYNLLTLTTYLQIDRLLPLIQKSITNQIDVPNLIKVLRFAQQRDLLLTDQLWKILLRHFNKLVEAEEYLKMTDEELEAALRSPKLNIDSRLESSVIANYIAKESAKSQKIQQLARNMSITGDGKASHPVVMNRIPREVIVCLGGWSSNGPTEIVEVFNPRNERWLRARIVEKESRAYHTLNKQGNHIYLTGGMDGREFFRQVVYYDLNTKEWVSSKDMVERRCYSMGVSIPFTDGSAQLMVMGGYNGSTRLSSCELVGTTSSGWRSAKPMAKLRSDGASVLLGEGVLAIGGFDGRTIHQDVELFDIATNSWTTLSKKMTSPRTGVSAVAMNRNVCFVAGGFNGTARLNTAELYDTREGRWHVLPRMNTTRSNFALEVTNGEFYAIGGFDGTATTNLCERYNMAAQRWQELPAISLPRSALKAFRLTDHDLIRELVSFSDVE